MDMLDQNSVFLTTSGLTLTLSRDGLTYFIYPLLLLAKVNSDIIGTCEQY